MKSTVVDADSASKMGIRIVTGEACALSMRLLCELDQDAMKKYIAYTGIRVDINSVSPSSFGFDSNRTNFNVFLTWEVIEDLIIMNLVERYEIVYEILPKENTGFVSSRFLLAGTRNELSQVINSDKYDRYEYDKANDRYVLTEGALYKVGRSYSVNKDQPRVGFSNVHAFSGTHH